MFNKFIIQPLFINTILWTLYCMYDLCCG